jgi:hypothetical protein
MYTFDALCRMCRMLDTGHTAPHIAVIAPTTCSLLQMIALTLYCCFLWCVVLHTLSVYSLGASIESYYRSGLNAWLNAKLTGRPPASMFPNFHIQIPARYVDCTVGSSEDSLLQCAANCAHCTACCTLTESNVNRYTPSNKSMSTSSHRRQACVMCMKLATVWRTVRTATSPLSICCSLHCVVRNCSLHTQLHLGHMHSCCHLYFCANTSIPMLL